MNKSDLLIIGMSPGNSYFKQNNINKLLDYATSMFENIEIFIPDIPAVATYIALGYPGTCRPFDAGTNWCDTTASTYYCLCNTY